MVFSTTAMKTKKAHRACEACSFWNPMEESHGECRRHAPQTVAFRVDESTKFESRFPTIKPSDWCGEFFARS
jgi:hypothetical protein